MKCETKTDVYSDLLPVTPSPEQPEGLRAQLSLESNAIWTDRMLEALKTGVKEDADSPTTTSQSSS